MNREPRKRKKIYFTAVGISFEILAVFILLLCVIHFIRKSGDSATTFVETETEEQIPETDEDISMWVREAGRTEQLKNDGDHYGYQIRYPVFDNPSVDQDISRRITEMIDIFALETTERAAYAEAAVPFLKVEYESFAAGDNFVSVIFHVEKMQGNDSPIASSVLTITYNLESGAAVSLSDIFQPGFEGRVSQLVVREFSANPDVVPQMGNSSFISATSALPGNFTSFALCGSEIRFYFSPGLVAPADTGVQSVTIQRAELEDLLRYDGNGTLKPTETQPPAPEPPSEVPPEEVPSEPVTEPAPTEPTPPASAETEPPVTFEAPTASVELDPNRPMVAFTFDDGPYSPVTGRILDVLETYQSKATFFVMGNRVNNYKDTLRRAYEMGCQIGNHSYNHKSFEKIAPEDVTWQIAYTNDLIQDIIGVRTSLVRVPYGAYHGQVSEVVKYPMIQWNIDPEDWKSKNKDAIVQNIMAHISDGDIILMHDLYPATAEAFEEVVPVLIEQGYQLVTVADLYAAKGIPLESGRVYFNTN